jgi:very-short-patch-repair endonuclease
MSPPEVALWSQLRASKLGFKVRRQHPIGPYVADFFIRDARLVVEVDGSPHDYGDRPGRDAARDRYIEQQGYRVLRVAAIDVLRNLDGVLSLISERVTNPLHHPGDGPPPHTGEDS